MKTSTIILGILFCFAGACSQTTAGGQKIFSVVNLAENCRVYINGGISDGINSGMKATLYERISLTRDGNRYEDMIPLSTSPVERVGAHISTLTVDSSTYRMLRDGSPVTIAGIIEPVKLMDSRIEAAPKNATPAEHRATSQTAPGQGIEKKEAPVPAPSVFRADAPIAPRQDTTSSRPTAPRRFDPIRNGFLHTPPEKATIYEPISITALAPPPMKSPRLFYRTRGSAEYRDVFLTPKPNDYYVYEIPQEEVVEPAIEYYLTVIGPTGSEELALGNPEVPVSIPVNAFLINPRLELARHGGNRNMVRIISERVDFGDSDSYEHFEADYLYRVFSTLYSIRMGMGTFRGQGHPLSTFSPDVQTLDYYYGYTEAELTFSKTQVSIIGRFLTGINNDGIGSGFDARLRFGDELGVNLVAGIWSTAILGTSTTLQLNVPLSARFGFSGNIAVEDLPLKGKTGFRMSTDLRYEVFDRFDLTGRIGMSARSAQLIGTNFGLGVARHF